MHDPSPSQPETVDSAPRRPADDEATPPRVSGTDPGGRSNVGTVAYASEAGGAGSPSSLPVIPGYEILGVLGHGGMGAVYKARETALDRLVALKVIVSGSHASPEQLARFRAEARAEARLHHPNIVQVHAVGECGGLPFLSLEYLDGGTLAQKIARQPQPPRAAAELIYLLARAMAYAHQRGILHRDLKPGNILLERGEAAGAADAADTNSKVRLAAGSSASVPTPSRESAGSWLDFVPKIADFGLAKYLEDDSAQTRTGSMLGTPAYMSPEQAAGRKDLGPASDVWALGVILYELLVGRTPFQGVTLMDTLEQVRTREPVPPTSLQPKVPTDLETVCLKCLRKEPAQRYASADALAEDLRRFLAGEPILARPVGAAERLARWCRRNPRLAALSTAVLLLLVALAAGSTAFAVVLDRRNGEIEQARRHAEQQAEIARAQEEFARKSAELARGEQLRADASAREAFRRYELLHDTLVVVIDQVQHGLKTVPGTAQVRREILESAMRVLQRSIAQAGDSTRQPERSLAAAHMIMGDILLEQKKPDGARSHYDRCHAILETLYRANPDNDKAAGNYAMSLSRQADLVFQFRNDADAALRLYEQALRIQEHSLAHRPARPELRTAELHRHLANSHQRMGEILLRARPNENEEIRRHLEKALEEFEKALEEGENILSNHQRLEQVSSQLGAVCERLGRPDEALRVFDRCLEVRRKLAAEFPADANRQLELVRLGAQVGDTHLFAGRTRTAERYYREAVAVNERLADRDRNPNTRLLLSLNHYRLATALLRLGERGLADEHYRKCLDLRLPLQQQNPNHLGLKIDVMIAQGRCGQHREAAVFAGELRRRFADNPTYLLHAACGYALCAFGLTRGRADADLTEPERRLRQEYVDRAVEALRQAKARGYDDLKNLQVEPVLDSVRQDRGFQMLLAEYAVPRPEK